MRGLLYNETVTQGVEGGIGKQISNSDLSEGRRNERRRIETRELKLSYFEETSKGLLRWYCHEQHDKQR